MAGCCAEFRSRKCRGDVTKTSPTYKCDRCGDTRQYCVECAGTWIASLLKIAQKSQRRSTPHDIMTRINAEKWYRKGFVGLIKHQACECGGVYCPHAHIPTFEDVTSMKPTPLALAQPRTPGSIRRSTGHRTTEIKVNKEEAREQVKTHERMARQRQKEMDKQLAIAETKRAIEARKLEQEAAAKARRTKEVEVEATAAADEARRTKEVEVAAAKARRTKEVEAVAAEAPSPLWNRGDKCWAARGAPRGAPRPVNGDDIPALEQDSPEEMIRALRHDMQLMAETHRREMEALKQTFATGVIQLRTEVVGVCKRLYTEIGAANAKAEDAQRRLHAFENPEWLTAGSSVDPWQTPL